MQLFAYLTFARANARFLAFGLLLAFASSAGQTYYIGVFGPAVREAFSLSHTEWGSVYLIGTLMSAAVLTWSGSLIDRFDLRPFSVCVLGGLVTACLVMSFASSFVMLIVAIFLLRQMGQGLTSHVASTSMARYHDVDRGKAVALISIGFTLGEVILPASAVILIERVGWRQTYQMTAFMIVIFIPCALLFLRGHSARHHAYLNHKKLMGEGRGAQLSVTRWQMLREKRFYLLLPAALMPSYISTGLFFHHLTLADAKGWSASWMTGSYWIYGVATVLALISTGPLIDRLSAQRVMPFFLIPLILSLILLMPVENAWWVLAYLFLGGLTSGVYFVGFVALWAELYGTRYLGAIKSTVGALSVFASALGPISIGFFLDYGVSIEMICLGFASLCIAATPLFIWGLKLKPGRPVL